MSEDGQGAPLEQGTALETPALGREPEDRPAWTVYVTILLTWLGIFVMNVAMMGVVLFIEVAKGALTFEEVRAKQPEVLERLVGRSTLVFIVGVVITSAVLAGVGLVASWRRAPWGTRFSSLLPRLGFSRLSLADAALSLFGVLGVTSMLDGLIYLLGLHETGSLAHIRELLSGLGGPRLLAAAVIIGIAPGLGEEVFFRGFVLKELARTQGPRVALVVSSLAFGLFHLDPVHTPLATVLGAYIAVCVLLTGSLWAGILAHAVNNALAALLAGGEIDALSATAWAVGGWVVATAALRALLARHPGGLARALG